MKTEFRYGVLLLLAIALGMLTCAQTQTTTTSKSKTTSSTKKKTPKPAAPAKDITVTLKSLCEKPILIYAGPKDGLKKPKITQYGGLSTNTLHVKSSDLVCIMASDNKKTVACVNLKTTTTALEVESSGFEIKVK